MISPIPPSLLLKIPLFKILFETHYDGFQSDFCDNYNLVYYTDPERNFTLFNEFYNSLTTIEEKILVHNLSVYYYRYQRNYWNKRPHLTYKILFWEDEFKKLLPSYDEQYDSQFLINLELETKSNSDSKPVINTPSAHEYILGALDMLFQDEIVPPELGPAFTLAILIVYYEFSEELNELLNITDPTPKII